LIEVSGGSRVGEDGGGGRCDREVPPQRQPGPGEDEE
jgi:hypothetical protein